MVDVSYVDFELVMCNGARNHDEKVYSVRREDLGVLATPTCSFCQNRYIPTLRLRLDGS